MDRNQKWTLKPLLLTLLAMLGGMLLQYCGHKITEPTVEERQLRPDEKDKTVIRDNVVINTKRTADGGTKTKLKYVPPEGKINVVVKKDGEVTVNVKNKGFAFAPGIGVGSIGGDLAPILDVKFAYFGRLGLTGGTGLTKETVARPYGAVSYHIWKNTSVFVGYSVKKDIVAGIRLSF